MTDIPEVAGSSPAAPTTTHKRSDESWPQYVERAIAEEREEIERLRVALQSVVQWLSLGLRHQGNLERYLRRALGELPASSDDPRDEMK